MSAYWTFDLTLKTQKLFSFISLPKQIFPLKEVLPVNFKYRTSFDLLRLRTSTRKELLERCLAIPNNLNEMLLTESTITI